MRFPEPTDGQRAQFRAEHDEYWKNHGQDNVNEFMDHTQSEVVWCDARAFSEAEKGKRRQEARRSGPRA